MCVEEETVEHVPLNRRRYTSETLDDRSKI